jgi:predicted 3-demethylubiquinone-9 3-methyltransferase (glyoxalase superfamily)
MQHNIYPCLWFNNQAKEAATFYCTIFSNSKITTDNGIVVMFELEGKKIMGLNGGSRFTINPSISFFVTIKNNNEIENTWDKLIDGGSAIMPLNKYPWAEKYGWLKDKFGMTWQLILPTTITGNQKIMPNLLFVGEQFGKAEEAMKFYTSIFPSSSIEHIKLYKAGKALAEGSVEFTQFKLGSENFIAMNGFSNHAFQFNEGLSFVVECDTQEEIDNYWNKLTEGGSESMCGWLKDKFGVSWQIVPSMLGTLMGDKEKGPRVMQAFLKMKKFDIETLLKI